MNLNLPDSIVLGIWCAGAVLAILLLLGLLRILYLLVIRPWRSRKLTMADLQNCRRYKKGKESVPQKILKLIIIGATTIFTALITIGFCLTNISHLTHTSSIQIALSLVEKYGPESEAVLDCITRMGSTRLEILAEVNKLIAEKEFSAQTESEKAEIEALCILRDILEGKITEKAAPANSKAP